MLRTERLQIRVASDDEMRSLIAAEANDELRMAYTEMLEGCFQHPLLRVWYGMWFIELLSGVRVGELCFKGLSLDGGVEIGYGISPEFWGMGYATEAVLAVTNWALEQPGVVYVSAETEADNIASQRVLQKAGFLPTGKCGAEGPLFVRSVRR